MSKIKFYCFCYSLIFAALCAPLGAQEGEIVDFTDQMTPVCELANLKAVPPARWINVPIETGEDKLQGCQMMLIIDQALIGVLRLLSFDLRNPPPDMPRWEEHVIGIEAVLIHEMGYRLNEPIWRKNDVPIAGQGFANATAFGFSATIEGNELPQEAHFLVFENSTHKYLIDLLTPAKSVDQGEHYDKNTQAMATVMRTLRVTTD